LRKRFDSEYSCVARALDQAPNAVERSKEIAYLPNG